MTLLDELKTPTLSNVLLIILVILVIFVLLTKLGSSEGLSEVDYDKYKAAYNQERDDAIGATSSGDPLNKKVASAWGNEGLTGGYESPSFWDAHQYNMEQQKGPSEVITTSRPDIVSEGMDDPLASLLGGGEL